MEGYATLKQFIQDYQLYLSAKKIDPGKEGETITSYLKKMIKKRLSSASKGFKAMVRKNNYAMDDLIMIAVHDTIFDIKNIDYFIRECFSVDYVTVRHYKRLLSSEAFKSGRLKRLYRYIPFKVETKKEFVRFLKSMGEIHKSDLAAIMNHISRKNWRKWLNELNLSEQGNMVSLI